ncbi:MAG: NAD(+)/NADH kinase [Verrucomicrobia bacterium]|nr:NAD(+)/NADH kinase [Verrucomicrobiota bacterium]
MAGLDTAGGEHASDLTGRVQLLIVFGGDGTLLRVAREIAGAPTPLLGINAGGLGFLTDVQAHELPLALEQVWTGRTQLTCRPLMEASGSACGRRVRFNALNDVVISRGSAPHLVELEVRVDDDILTRYRCDGLIVCTATGSTAYSLSAGGAIVSPQADVFALTPICPHTLSNRSIILSLDATVRIRALSPSVETVLSADGQGPTLLACGDTIAVRRSRHAIRLVHLAGSSFFDTLRRKLGWRGASV